MTDDTNAPVIDAPPADTAPEPISVSSLMADMEKAATTPEPAKPEPKAAPKVEPAKTEPEKSKAPEPAKKVEPPVKEDGGSLRRNLVEAQKERDALKKEREELLKKQITPDIQRQLDENKKEVEAAKTELEQRRKELEDSRKELAESAYERSDDFKKKYVAPYNAKYGEVLGLVKQLTVDLGDGNSRPATESDLLKVGYASPAERAAIARQLFGDNALTVLSEVRELERMQSDKVRVLTERREQFDVMQKEWTTRQQQEQQMYSKHREQSRAELIERYPEYFGEDANDPEINEALKKGFEFVDDAGARVEKMSVDERAAFAEVVRARAGAFPRVLKQLQKSTSKIAELEAELKKYRKSDPGELNDEGRGEKPQITDEVGGVEQMAERMQKIATGG